MPITDARVVLVDDDASFREVMARELGRMGFGVRVFVSSVGVVEYVGSEAPQAVVLDLRMPGQDGLKTLQNLLLEDPDVQVIVLTGHGSVSDAVQAMRYGALDFLTKPVTLDILEQTLHKAVAASNLITENRRLRRIATADSIKIPELVSAASRELERQTQKIGHSDKGVLVTGESGAGKEIAARMLHAFSPRTAAPFVAVNCGAIPAQLIESELFGHRRGAFTGADTKRLGLFEAANKGTLFLDEIGELPLELQPALLRAIQFGEIRKVGSDDVRIVDVRLIVATNHDLRSMAEKGQFREDLFFRLAVLELYVPPLRERREDIPMLARHFLAREVSRANRLLRLTDAAVQALTEEEWPGNIRQLENAMVRVAVLASGPDVDAGEIRDLLAPGKQVTRKTAQLPTLALRDLERLAVEAALLRFDGNKRRAAEELGIALKTLYNKLNRANPSE